jgi:hypothetical protein
MYNLKKDIEEWVGDVSYEANSLVPGAQEDKRKYEGPKKDLAGPSRPGDKPLASAFERNRYDKRLLVWQGLNRLMKDYCNFKKNNGNSGTEIFQKKRPVSALKEEDWKSVDSLHIKLSVNILDQIFKVAVMRTPVDKYNCDSFTGSQDSMPTSSERVSSNSVVFDSCEGDNAKICLRNILMFRVTKAIVESLLNMEYRHWFVDLNRFAQNEVDERDINYLFCSSMDKAEGCNISDIVEEQIETNIIEWVQFTEKLSKIAQGLGGASGFVPASNNLSNFRPDSAAGAPSL